MTTFEDIELEERITYNPLYATVPIRALNLSCRRKLAMALNPKLPLPSTYGYTRDWQGLVEAIGYPYEVNKLLSNREDPTMALLDIWEKHASNPTIANLLEFLQTIERFDVITDILPLLERDTQQYMKSEEENKRLHEKPIQVPIVTSVKQTASAPLFTIHEVLKTRQPAISVSTEEISIDDDEYVYDAYVSYVDSDIEFVYTLIEKMEGEHRLKLFVKDRDLLAGFDEAAADIRIIYERCKRILLIISPEFLSDPKCEYTTMFAQALAVDNNLYARKVIPVICKPCELSVRLKYIARVDYTKRDLFGKFWDRLYYSIKNPILGELPAASTSIGTITGTGTSRISPSLVDLEDSAELSNNDTKSKRPVSSNLAPTIKCEAPTVSGAVVESEDDSRTFSNSTLSPAKTDKKKKSPTYKRRFLFLGRTRAGAQTQ